MPDETARAERIRVQLTDLPTGFREVGNDGQDTGNVSDNFDRCFASSRASIGMMTGEAVFFGFEGSNSRNVGSAALVATDTSVATKVIDVVAAEPFLDCFREGVKSGLKNAADGEENFAIEQVQGGRVSFPNVADQTFAYQIETGFSSDGFDGRVFIDFVALRRERAVALVLFTDVVTAFDSTQKQEILEKVAARAG